MLIVLGGSIAIELTTSKSVTLYYSVTCLAGIPFLTARPTTLIFFLFLWGDDGYAIKRYIFFLKFVF